MPPVSVLFLASVLAGGANSPRSLGLKAGSTSSSSNGIFDGTEGAAGLGFHGQDERMLDNGGGEDTERCCGSPFGSSGGELSRLGG